MIHKAVNRSSLFLLSTAEDLNSEGLTFAYDISDFHNTSCQRESEIATHPFESVCNYRINRHRVLIEFEPSGSNRRSIDLPRASLAPYRRISAHRMGRPVCIVTPANSCGLTKQHLAWCCSPSQETIDRGMDTRYYREGRGRVKGGGSVRGSTSYFLCTSLGCSSEESNRSAAGTSRRAWAHL